MRILVVSQYFWPETFRVNEIVSELTSRGHEVTVLTGRPNYPEGVLHPDFAADPSRFSRYAGARVLRVPLRPRGTGSLRLMLNYWSFVFWGCVKGPWLLRGQAFDSIFVFETSPITSALPAILLKWIKRTSLSMWVLDLWPDTLKAVGMVKTERQLRVVGLLCRFIYRRCDLILGQSRAFVEPIRRWAGPDVRFRYFPQWSEEVFDSPAEHLTAAPELAQHANHFNILFAGNIGEAQDFPALLKAASLTRHRRDIRWLIVGDGRAAPVVREKITQLGLTETVFMLGRYPVERMPAFFATADALLVSLKADPIFAMTIPGKVQSYLAVGKPILGMLDGEGARVITESGAGLVAPSGDAEALARQALALADMAPDTRSHMGESGRRYGSKHFRRESLMNQLETWLAGLLRLQSTRAS
ncbi:glycosyltransferase family 4 protein [Rubrivivax gelatinosus]|uniref:glycosyltransferase family 4 protein n=1 Tax=Rubrivivax gelatinosus TaxID=28068 RepID=UPI0005C1E76F|nr:glycosyltransferase family 4 protein [Rubrivivax gelatinosus]MBG6079407.1 glycosyltransferase involved in cell wall biosynthesis [Rubrivivax gelatinosus]